MLLAKLAQNGWNILRRRLLQISFWVPLDMWCCCDRSFFRREFQCSFFVWGRNSFGRSSSGFGVTKCPLPWWSQWKAVFFSVVLPSNALVQLQIITSYKQLKPAFEAFANFLPISNFMLMSELTEKVVDSHLIELVFMRSFYQRIVETALVREYNYVILDIVVVNTGR